MSDTCFSRPVQRIMHTAYLAEALEAALPAYAPADERRTCESRPRLPVFRESMQLVAKLHTDELSLAVLNRSWHFPANEC